MLLHVSIFHSFLLLSKIPQYAYITICLSVHPWMDIWVAFSLELLQISCYDYSRTDLCVNIGFHFS